MDMALLNICMFHHSFKTIIVIFRVQHGHISIYPCWELCVLLCSTKHFHLDKLLQHINQSCTNT